MQKGSALDDSIKGTGPEKNYYAMRIRAMRSMRPQSGHLILNWLTPDTGKISVEEHENRAAVGDARRSRRDQSVST